MMHDALPDIERALRSGLKLRIGYDGTKYIDDALKEILHTLLETLLIVTLVIFLFLGSFRSVIIPIVAMPLSLVGALFRNHRHSQVKQELLVFITPKMLEPRALAR